MSKFAFVRILRAQYVLSISNRSAMGSLAY